MPTILPRHNVTGNKVLSGGRFPRTRGSRPPSRGYFVRVGGPHYATWGNNFPVRGLDPPTGARRPRARADFPPGQKSFPRIGAGFPPDRCFDGGRGEGASLNLNRKLDRILEDLKYWGPEQPIWPTYSPSGKVTCRCNLNYCWAACWRHVNGRIEIEVYKAGSHEDAPD